MPHKAFFNVCKHIPFKVSKDFKKNKWNLSNTNRAVRLKILDLNKSRIRIDSICFLAEYDAYTLVANGGQYKIKVKIYLYNNINCYIKLITLNLCINSEMYQLTTEMTKISDALCKVKKDCPSICILAICMEATSLKHN